MEWDIAKLGNIVVRQVCADDFTYYEVRRGEMLLGAFASADHALGVFTVTSAEVFTSSRCPRLPRRPHSARRSA